MKDGHLYGSLIDILRFGAPLMLVALGMTLVIATGGIDLSVGSVVAISGALACLLISQLATRTRRRRADRGRRGARRSRWCSGCGTASWSRCIGIQPIIATLILMVAGRGIAQLITERPDHHDQQRPVQVYRRRLLARPAVLDPHRRRGRTALTALLTRRTALGMLLESVGGNAEASRLAGIRSRGLILLVYVFCGPVRRHRRLMISSNVSSADGNNAGLWIELDAILAVVIGGTALTGGRFSLAGTVVGALLIQTLTTTIYTIGIPPETTLLFKALVVTVVCLLQSPGLPREGRFQRRRRRPQPAPVARPPTAGRGARMTTAARSPRRRRRKLPQKYVPVLATLVLLVVMFTVGAFRYPAFSTAGRSSTSSSTTRSCSSSRSA